MTTIQHLVDRLDELPELSTIYARPPWTPESDADLKSDPEDESNPFEEEGLEYFLEVFIAREVLEPMENASAKSRCQRVIQYAINDA